MLRDELINQLKKMGNKETEVMLYFPGMSGVRILKEVEDAPLDDTIVIHAEKY